MKDPDNEQHYCDYDGSDKASDELNQSLGFKRQSISRPGTMRSFASRKPVGDLDDYFNSQSTKNAQTVSWKRRHLPVSVILANFVSFMFLVAFYLLVYIEEQWWLASR